MDKHFLNTSRLLEGPWQAFERDVAQLLKHCGYDGVKVVGQSGDKGADILATNRIGNWVVQCKHTTTSPPPLSALDEIVEAGKFYQADVLCVATSRPPSTGMERYRNLLKQTGVKVRLWGPGQLIALAERSKEYCRAMHNSVKTNQKGADV